MNLRSRTVSQMVPGDSVVYRVQTDPALGVKCTLLPEFVWNRAFNNLNKNVIYRLAQQNPDKVVEITKKGQVFLTPRSMCSPV